MNDRNPLRSLPELLEETAPFACDDPVRSWTAVLSTGALTVAALAVAAGWTGVLLRLIASGLASLLLVRMFVLYHDYEHGAILRNSTASRALFSSFGLFILSPPKIWMRLHNYHHSHNCQFVTSGAGSFPVMTVPEYRSAPRRVRWIYRLIRSPLMMIAAYFTIFLTSFCMKSVHDEPGRHRDSLAAIVVHLSLIAAYAHFGWTTLLFGLLGPLVTAHAIGAYLFYAQHNFPGVKLQRREEWDYVFASVYSSSFMEGGAIMRWFTGNIGYHQVHHLNSRIPFYRLPEVMAAIPELRLSHRTSLRFRDVVACLRLKLWDPRQGCMTPFPSRGSDVVNSSTTRLAWLQRLTAAAIIAFWTFFWFQRDHMPAAVVDFELNFILPDLVWVVGLLICSSRWLIARNRRGLLASGAAGGALVFLGLLDLMFNLRHGQYTEAAAQGLLNASINAGCISFGLWNLYVAAGREYEN